VARRAAAHDARDARSARAASLRFGQRSASSSSRSRSPRDGCAKTIRARFPDRPCGRCASCRLHAARSHPDLLVLVPEALRDALGWDAGSEGEEGGEGGKRKPSKDIRVEAVRAAIALRRRRRRAGAASSSSSIRRADERGRCERVSEDARGAAGRRALPALLGRSRCAAAHDSQPLPARAAGSARCKQATAWLEGQGIADAAVLLAASGGHPQDAVELASRGIGAALWLALPRSVAQGDATPLLGWPLPLAVDALQKLCHDALCVACGGSPRYFPRDRLDPGGSFAALLRWSRELARVATEAEHPWSVDLAIESLVGQGREALKTSRSG
jgi:DNA polymerase-3 subunit delta'